VEDECGNFHRILGRKSPRFQQLVCPLVQILKLTKISVSFFEILNSNKDSTRNPTWRRISSTREDISLWV
jgi:hypothetical protein